MTQPAGSEDELRGEGRRRGDRRERESQRERERDYSNRERRDDLLTRSTCEGVEEEREELEEGVKVIWAMMAVGREGRNGELERKTKVGSDRHIFSPLSTVSQLR